MIHQWLVLTGRNLRVVLSSRSSLLTTLLQAPLIAAFALIAFADFGRDDPASDYFSRVVHYFRQYKAPYEERGDTLPLHEVIVPRVRDSVDQETRLISVSAAQRRAAIYFVLVSGAIWIGVMGACREIVDEKDVIFRELRTCVDAFPYVVAKCVAQGLLVGGQTAVLAGVVASVLLHGGWQAVIVLWAVLWAAGFAAACLGLLVSAVARDSRTALTIVPVLMIPQLLLGGLLRPPAQAGEASVARRLCEYATIQRWGFEAAVATDSYRESGVVSVEFASWDLRARYAEFNLLKSEEKGIMSLLFRETALDRARPTEQPYVTWVFLSRLALVCLFAVLFLLGTWVAVRTRFG